MNEQAEWRLVPVEPVAEPVALETVYETIIRWDEGGGKRSRRELARRIVALYAAMPSPRREPTCSCGDPTTLNTIHRADGACYVPAGVYRRREPLSDDEIVNIVGRWLTTTGASYADFIRWVEAAHGITGGRE